MRIMDSIKAAIEADNRSQMWVAENAQYVTIMGSHAYGTNVPESDYDIYGFTMPPRTVLFPFHHGYIYGFSKNVPNFGQYEKKHILSEDGKEIDADIYSIVKYFALCMENNPNMLDSLFTRNQCVILCTDVGEMVRLNRRAFLHRGSWFKFKGYAYSQLKKAKSQTRKGKRKEDVEEFGYDRKFAMHIFRLLGEIEQILRHGDMDLMRDKEELKYIRAGNYTIDQIETMFRERESMLEELYHSCDAIPDRPDVVRIQQLLVDCLEQHFGSLGEVEKQTGGAVGSLIRDVEAVLDRYRRPPGDSE